MWDHANETLQKAAEAYKIQADKKHSPQAPFKVGKQVYLSTKYLRLKVPSQKLAPEFLGPVPIIQVINSVTVELKLPPLLGKTHPVFHSSLLCPVRTAIIRGAPKQVPLPIQVGGELHYKVERILDSHRHRGHVQYLVQWKGYAVSVASWVKEEVMRAPWLVKRFHQQNSGKPGWGGRADPQEVANAILCLPGVVPLDGHSRGPHVNPVHWTARGHHSGGGGVASWDVRAWVSMAMPDCHPGRKEPPAGTAFQMHACDPYYPNDLASMGPLTD